MKFIVLLCLFANLICLSADNGKAVVMARKKDGEQGYKEIKPENRNHKVLPGEHMDLKVLRRDGTELTGVSKVQWSIPESKFDDYRISSDEAFLSPFSEWRLKKNPCKDWYWVSRGKTVEVKCEITHADGTDSVSRNIILVDPENTLIVTKFGEFYAGTEELTFASDIIVSPGIVFEGKVKVDDPDLPGGKWNYTQTFSPTGYFIKNGATKYHPDFGNRGCDTRFPYTPDPLDFHPGGNPGTWPADGGMHEASDTPGAEYRDFSEVGFKEWQEFSMYLMFLPNGEKSRFVPLKRADWKIKGAARKVGGVFDLVPGSAGQEKTEAMDEFIHPEWDRLITAGAENDFKAKGALKVSFARNQVLETEGLLPSFGTVSISSPADGDVLVVLEGPAVPGIITIPATVTIPNGATSIKFDVQLGVNVAKGRNVPVPVKATDGPDYSSGSGRFTVIDVNGQ